MTPMNETTPASTAGITPAALNGNDRPTLLAGALAGIVFVLGAFITAPDGPSAVTATADQIRTFLTANDAALRIATAGGLVGLVAVLVFVVSLTRLIRTHLPGSLLADAVLAAGMLMAVLYWLSNATTSMTLLLPGLIGADIATVDDATLRGWYGLTGFTHYLGDLQMPPLTLLLAAFSIAALRGRLIPRWISILGLTLAGCAILGVTGIVSGWPALYPLWFVALIGWVLWTLLTSVAFGLRWRRLGR